MTAARIPGTGAIWRRGVLVLAVVLTPMLGLALAVDEDLLRVTESIATLIDGGGRPGLGARLLCRLEDSPTSGTGVRHDRLGRARLPAARAGGDAARLQRTCDRLPGAGGRRLAHAGGRRDRRCCPPLGPSAGPGSHGIRSRCAGGCISPGRDGRLRGTRARPTAVGRVRRVRGYRPRPSSGGLARTPRSLPRSSRCRDGHDNSQPWPS